MILTDVRKGDVNLNRMIEVFIKVVPNPVEVININEMTIKGGCLGCVKCGYENKCIYTDDVQPVYQGRLMTADAIVFAGAVRYRFLLFGRGGFLPRLTPCRPSLRIRRATRLRPTGTPSAASSAWTRGEP